MEKRYQVFISSTFQDLQPARQEVSQALLRADCFPAGMELFPAADEEQFAFIKQIIDQSDYYIIISAGRYGSIHPETGLSYTEMEYDYAVETGKPVIRLLHKDPFNQLKGEFIEQTDRGREQLRTFREKLSTASLVRFWEEPKELGAEVVYGIMDCHKRYEAIGWIRPNNFAKDEGDRKDSKSDGGSPIITPNDFAFSKQDFENRVFMRDHALEVEFTVENHAQTVTLRRIQLLKFIAAECLDESDETKIEQSVCWELLAPFNGYQRYDFDGKFRLREPKIREFFRELEADGILRSEVVRRDFPPSKTIAWSVVDGARPWAACVAISKGWQSNL